MRGMDPPGVEQVRMMADAEVQGGAGGEGQPGAGRKHHAQLRVRGFRCKRHVHEVTPYALSGWGRRGEGVRTVSVFGRLGSSRRSRESLIGRVTVGTELYRTRSGFRGHWRAECDGVYGSDDAEGLGENPSSRCADSAEVLREAGGSCVLRPRRRRTTANC